MLLFMYVFIYVFIIIKVELICSVSSNSVIQQSDPITYISLCCTVRVPLPIHSKYNSLTPQNPKTPIHHIPSPFPLGNPKSACLVQTPSELISSQSKIKLFVVISINHLLFFILRMKFYKKNICYSVRLP